MNLNEIKALEDSLTFPYSPTEIKYRMSWLGISKLLTVIVILIIIGKCAVFKAIDAYHKFNMKNLEVTLYQKPVKAFFSLNLE